MFILILSGGNMVVAAADQERFSSWKRLIIPRTTRYFCFLRLGWSVLISYASRSRPERRLQAYTATDLNEFQTRGRNLVASLTGYLVTIFHTPHICLATSTGTGYDIRGTNSWARLRLLVQLLPQMSISRAPFSWRAVETFAWDPSNDIKPAKFRMHGQVHVRHASCMTSM